MINFILAIISFITGTFLGSFYTLAVYRIPLNKNITYERSFCPNCNHKLQFLDLIPIWSYVFLGGKCRYCKQKIRPRYLILELTSGLAFMFYILSLNIDILNFAAVDLINILFVMCYLSVFAIIIGIDLDKNIINKKVLNFTFVLDIIYTLYLYILGINIYRYIIYIIIAFALLLIDKYKPSYVIKLISLIILTIIFTNSSVAIVSIIFTLLAIAIKSIISKNKKLNIAAVYSIITIILVIIQNYIIYR